MVGTMLSGAVASSVAQGIWDLALGNPLFTRELVLDGLASAQLRQIDGVWLWTDRLEPGPRLNDLLLRRLEPLAPSIREAIDVVASDDRVSLSDACTIVSREAITSAESPVSSSSSTMDGDDSCDSCTRSTPRWLARRCPLRPAIASGRPSSIGWR